MTDHWDNFETPEEKAANREREDRSRESFNNREKEDRRPDIERKSPGGRAREK